MPVSGLTILAFTLAYAVYRQGGVWARDWNLCLLEIGLLAIAYCLAGRKDRRLPLDRLSRWLIVAFASLTASQVLPLPLALVRVLSPARAELFSATLPVLGDARWLPLSATPALTGEHLLRLGGYLLVFLLVRDMAWRLKDFAWLPVLPLIAIAACEAAAGLVQSYFQGAPMATGSYVNHNHFAGFLEMCLPFAVLYPAAILRRPRSPGCTEKGRSATVPALKACGLLLIAALIFAAILLSLSRMGAVASLLSLFIVGCLAIAAEGRFRMRPLAMASLLVTALLVLLLFPGPLAARFQAPVSTGDFLWRAGIWKDTLGLIQAFPLFGCGLGAYESTFPRYQTVAPMFTIDFAHNDYLQYLAELGAIAFLAGLALVLRLFTQTLRAAIHEPSIDRRYVALACTGSLLAILLHSLADFNLYIPANAMLLAWIGGIGAARVSTRSLIT